MDFDPNHKYNLLFNSLKLQFSKWNPIGLHVPEEEYDGLVQKVCILQLQGASEVNIYEEIYYYLKEYMGLDDISPQNIKDNIKLNSY